MTTIEYSAERPMFWTILSDGKLHHAVPEGTEGAVRREYETSDGAKGVKFELLAESLAGKIENLALYDGGWGKQLQIFFAKDEPKDRQVVLSLSMSSSFGEDFAKKLPNIDTAKEVKLVPYSFEDEGKKKRGITVYQDGVKLQSRYSKEKVNGKGWENINGYPEVPKEAKEWDSDEWKVFFIQARKFLVSEIEKHPLYNAVEVNIGEDTVEYPEEDAPADKF